MKKIITQLLAATLVLAAIPLTASNTLAQESPGDEGTTSEDALSFVCATAKGRPATLIQRGDNSAPMVIWNTKKFGGSWNPKQRCKTVTSRLNNLLASSPEAAITSGELNGLPVVCAISDESEECNSKNLLFTLLRGKNADTVVEQIEGLIAGQADVPPIDNNTAKPPRRVVKLRSLSPR